MKNISECALECSLKIGVWGAQKTDRRLSDHLSEYTGGDNGFKAVKRLVPKRFLDPINAIVRQLRKDFHTYTLPWLHDGTGLLPVSLHAKFMQCVMRHQSTMTAEVEKLISEMPVVRLAAQTQLGDAYNPDEIPSDEEIRSLFSIDMKMRPIKAEGDFRLEMSEDVVESIKEDYKKELTDQVAMGTANAYSRLVGVLEHMVTGLERHGTELEGTERTGSFKNAIIDNVGALSDILDDLNVTDDEALTDLSSDVRTRLTVFSPDDLREDASVRQAVIQDAKEILSRAKTGVGGYFGV